MKGKINFRVLFALAAAGGLYIAAFNKCREEGGLEKKVSGEQEVYNQTASLGGDKIPPYVHAVFVPNSDTQTALIRFLEKGREQQLYDAGPGNRIMNVSSSDGLERVVDGVKTAEFTSVFAVYDGKKTRVVALDYSVKNGKLNIGKPRELEHPEIVYSPLVLHGEEVQVLGHDDKNYALKLDGTGYKAIDTILFPAVDYRVRDEIEKRAGYIPDRDWAGAEGSGRGIDVDGKGSLRYVDLRE